MDFAIREDALEDAEVICQSMIVGLVKCDEDELSLRGFAEGKRLGSY